MTRVWTLTAAVAAGWLAAADVATAQARLGPPANATRPVVAASEHAFTASDTDTATTSFTAGGVRVILRRNTANDVVAVNLYLLGGTRNAPEGRAGIEPLLLAVSERGTRRYSRDALRQRSARLGSTFVVEPRSDWTMFGFRAVRATFDSTWAVFADRAASPRLDSADVAIVRAQLVSAIRQRQDSPDALVEQLADSITFAGHPYSIPEAGTEESLRATTVRDLRQYHEQQFVTSRMLLVVVGNIERARLEQLVTAAFGRLPAGNYRWSAPDAPTPITPEPLLLQRPLPTNYMLGYYLGPPSSSADYQALRIASAVLSGRLFGEIRSRRNLTYAVDAPFVERAHASGGLYVTTAYPDTVLAIMRSEVGRMVRNPIAPDDLRQLVGQFLTEYFLNNETNGAQADFLARAELYRGDFRAAERFVDELRAVTPEDIRRVAATYMRNVRFVYIGDTRNVSRERLGGL